MALGRFGGLVVWGNKFREHGPDSIIFSWEYKLLEGQNIMQGVFQTQLGTEIFFKKFLPPT